MLWAVGALSQSGLPRAVNSGTLEDVVMRSVGKLGLTVTARLGGRAGGGDRASSLLPSLSVRGSASRWGDRDSL